MLDEEAELWVLGNNLWIWYHSSNKDGMQQIPQIIWTWKYNYLVMEIQLWYRSVECPEFISSSGCVLNTKPCADSAPRCGPTSEIHNTRCHDTGQLETCRITCP